MFNKLFKKLDEIKDEVLDQASQHISDASKNVTQGLGDAINEKKSDLFSSVLGKVTESVSSSANYLAQVEKMANERRATELGITSRQLIGLSTEEIAHKYGLTVEQYKEKLEQEVKQYNNEISLTSAAKNVKDRAETELRERQSQAEQVGLTMEEFNNLTLQEQADKLNITLDTLLVQRALKF